MILSRQDSRLRPLHSLSPLLNSRHAQNAPCSWWNSCYRHCSPINHGPRSRPIERSPFTCPRALSLDCVTVATCNGKLPLLSPCLWRRGTSTLHHSSLFANLFLYISSTTLTITAASTGYIPPTCQGSKYWILCMAYAPRAHISLHCSLLARHSGRGFSYDHMDAIQDLAFIRLVIAYDRIGMAIPPTPIPKQTNLGPLNS